jgi:glycosyltransferase involved in cell wall biosynthesis
VRALHERPIWPPEDEVAAEHAAWALEDAAASRVDVAQVNVPWALPVARGLGLPVVYTLHHARDQALSSLYARERDPWYVAISARQLRLEVPLLRARVVHHGVPVGAYPFSPVSGGWVAHVGRFAEEKGTHLAIDAARLAGAPLLLAGRSHPQDGAYFEREIAPRLGPGVELCGEADHARKVEILGGSDALLCPIQWEEPFGLVAIEAMLTGTPVLGYPHGSFPELVDEGVTGYLVHDVEELASAIARARRLDRAACARRARERFSADRMADAYERILARAAESDEPRAAAGA